MERAKGVLIAKILFALALTLAVSFAVAGYQAILPVFQDVGAYSDLCTSSDSRSTTENKQGNTVYTCDEQLAKLNNMYTISVSILNFMTLPTGFLVAVMGPLFTSALGSGAMLLSVLLLAFSSSSFQAWNWAYMGMAAAGPLVIFPVLSLPARFGSHQGLLFSLIVGATDGSSIVFYVIQLLYFYTGLSYIEIFLIYATFPLMLFFGSFWLYPFTIPFSTKKKAARAVTDGSAEGETQPLVDRDTGQTPEDIPAFETSVNSERLLSVCEPETEAAEDAHPMESLREAPGRLEKWTEPWLGKMAVKDILLSLPYVLLAIWFSVYTTNNYFYIENVNNLLDWVTDGDSHQTAVGTSVFSVLLPITVVFTPVTSFLLDRYPVELSYMIMGWISFVSGVLSVLPVYWLQFPGMFLLVFNRFYFNSTAPFMLTLLYGSAGTTTVYGIVNFVAATANLSNYLWSYLVIKNPNNFYLLNIGLPSACLLSATFMACYVWRLKLALQSRQSLA